MKLVKMKELHQFIKYQEWTMNMRCRHRSRSGGGVLILSSNFLKSIVIEGLSVISFCLESIFITFVFKSKRFFVGKLYRPPNSNLSRSNSDLIWNLDNSETECSDSIFHLMGDYNIHLLKITKNWKYFGYFSILSSYGFCPCIMNPTRATLVAKLI